MHAALPTMRMCHIGLIRCIAYMAPWIIALHYSKVDHDSMTLGFPDPTRGPHLLSIIAEQ